MGGLVKSLAHSPGRCPNSQIRYLAPEIDSRGPPVVLQLLTTTAKDLGPLGARLLDYALASLPALLSGAFHFSPGLLAYVAQPLLEPLGIVRRRPLLLLGVVQFLPDFLSPRPQNLPNRPEQKLAQKGQKYEQGYRLRQDGLPVYAQCFENAHAGYLVIFATMSAVTGSLPSSRKATTRA